MKTSTLVLQGLAVLGIVLVTVAPALAWSAAELDKAKASGVKFIRSDLFPRSQDGGGSQNYVNAAKARGIQVIGIVKSDPFKPYVSFWYLCGWWSWCYYDWGVTWQEYVRTVIDENKHWVKDWQIDNELITRSTTPTRRPTSSFAWTSCGWGCRRPSRRTPTCAPPW